MNTTDEMYTYFHSDCEKCSGLCCVALYFSKIDGFPENKRAGKPCLNLQRDFQCQIHSALELKGMKGCICYDCFGAGPQVTKELYRGITWKNQGSKSEEIFKVFSVIFQLSQIRFYLVEARKVEMPNEFYTAIQGLLDKNNEICNSTPTQVLSFDVDEYRKQANVFLKEACQANSKNKQMNARDYLGKSCKGQAMDYLDLSMKLLIATDFSNCTFHHTVFLGADTRSADFSNADLRGALFLSQGQVNAAKGNQNTQLPHHLTYPITWRK